MSGKRKRLRSKRTQSLSVSLSTSASESLSTSQSNSEFAVNPEFGPIQSKNKLHSLSFNSKSLKQIPTRKQIKTDGRETDPRPAFIKKLRKCPIVHCPSNFGDDLYPMTFVGDLVEQAYSSLSMKTNLSKNENDCIKVFNAKLYLYIKNCFRRMYQHTQSGDLPQHETYVLKNAVCCWFLKPNWTREVLNHLKEHLRVKAYFAICLGICSPWKCADPHCQSVDLRFLFHDISINAKTQNRSQCVWICNSCRKEQSIWKHTGFDKWRLRPRKGSDEPFCSLFETAYGLFAHEKREQTTNRTINTSMMHAKMRKIIFHTITTFETLNPIQLGDANVQVYMDHTYLNATKYGKGYQKELNGFDKVLGLTSDRGLVILEPVDGETALETNYHTKSLVKANSNIVTDMGGSFSKLTNCTDDNNQSLYYTHQTCNHSGTKSHATGVIHRFTNPNELDIHGRNVCSNRIEGAFGKFQQLCISKYPERMKNYTGKEALCRYYQFALNRTSFMPGHMVPIFAFIFTWVYPPNGAHQDMPQREDWSERYEVRQVMDQREKDGELQYLVRWSGYPIYQSSWVFEDESYRDAINDYANLTVSDKEMLRGSYQRSMATKRQKIGKIKLIKLSQYWLDRFLVDMFDEKRVADAARKARGYPNNIRDLQIFSDRGRIEAQVISSSRQYWYSVIIGFDAESHKPCLPFSCQCSAVSVFCYHMMSVLLQVTCD